MPPAALQLCERAGGLPARPQRLSLGCPVLDRLLRGGLPLDGVTELAGLSSAGKTQLALQLCLAVQFPPRHGGLDAGEWPRGAAPGALPRPVLPPTSPGSRPWAACAAPSRTGHDVPATLAGQKPGQAVFYYPLGRGCAGCSPGRAPRIVLWG